jgi:hypothetical protein
VRSNFGEEGDELDKKFFQSVTESSTRVSPKVANKSKELFSTFVGKQRANNFYAAFVDRATLNSSLCPDTQRVSRKGPVITEALAV